MAVPGEFHVRPAERSDAAGIARIYNQGIEDRIATFETRQRAPSEILAWFGGAHPIIVVEAANALAAFAATSAYRNRACYAGIAEVSLYVDREFRGQGVGRLAMQAIIQAAEKAGFWKLVSRVFVENQASRRLIASTGFREVGVYEKHAKLEGSWRDVVIVERLIPSNLS